MYDNVVMTKSKGEYLMDNKPKLTSLHVNTYALSNGLLTMASTAPMTYIMMFCTDYLGISPVAYGTAMGIAKTFDFFVCILAGPIIEKSNMKHGKYISWVRILTCTLFFGNIIQLMDTSAFISNPTIKLIIVCIGYCLFHGSMNFNATVRGSLVRKLAGANMEDRRRLTTRQSQVGAAVSIIASAITLPCISFVEGLTGSPTLGYFLVTLAFSLCFLACNIFFIKLASPFDPPAPQTAAKQSASLKDMIEAIVTNKQMFILVLTYTLFNVGSQISAGVTTYFFRVTGTFSKYTIAITTRSIVAFIASMVIPPIGKKIGKKNSLVLGRFLWSAGALFIYIFALRKDGSANLVLMTIGMCMLRAATYTYMPFGVNYWLDCAEYGYYTTGKDMRGFAAAIMNIPTKIGMAIGGTAVGYLVAWAGYVPPVGDKLGYFEHMNRYMMVIGLIPAVIGVAAGILTMFFYKLTDEEAAMYAKANAEKDSVIEA
ncbi:MAG: hypothetical protein E7218_02455 [Anaerofustis stercorihominis]|nr:hypothetical protein [Anaerofustis stercorihominis]